MFHRQISGKVWRPIQHHFHARKLYISNQTSSDHTHSAKLHEPINQHNHKNNNGRGNNGRGSFFGLGAGLLIFGAATVYAYLDQEDKRQVDLQEFEQMKKNLLTSCESRPGMQRLMISLLEGVGLGDLEIVDKRLNNLNVKQYEITREQFDLLINITALQCKASVLNLMVEYFGAAEVNSVPRAKKLLSHELKDDLEQLTAGFFNYYYQPRAGLFNGTNMRVGIEKYQDDFLHSQPQLETYGMDIIDDMAAMLAYEKEYRAKLSYLDRSISAKYDNTAIIPASDIDGAALFSDFLDNLKEKATHTDKPVTGSFILTATHFTSGDIQLINDGNQIKAAVLYFDSLGHPDGGYLTGFYDDNNYLTILKKHFPDVEIRISESKLQYQSHGCPIFSLIRTAQGIEADKTLLQLAEYQNSNSEELLFQYAKDHRSRRALGMYFDDNDQRNHAFDYENFPSPVAFEITKCSFGNKALVDKGFYIADDGGDVVYYDATNQEVQMKFSNEQVMLVGQLGITQESNYCQQNNEQRYREFSTPMFNGATPNQTIARYTQEINGRPVNTMIRTNAGEQGLALAQWIVDKSPNQIREMRDQYVYSPALNQQIQPSVDRPRK